MVEVSYLCGYFIFVIYEMTVKIKAILLLNSISRFYPSTDLNSYK